MEKTTVKKERAKSISLTAEQLRNIADNREIALIIARMVDDSDGNLKGQTAYQGAVASFKQIEVWKEENKIK